MRIGIINKSFSFFTKGKTKVNLILFKDKELHIEVYLGGNRGKLFYELIESIFFALYITIVLTTIAIIEYFVQKINIEDVQILLRILYLYLGYKFAVKIAPKIPVKTKEVLLDLWVKYVADKPIALFNISNQPHTSNNQIFIEFNIPPNLILGLRKETDGIILYDYNFRIVYVRGNYHFNESDHDNLIKIIVEHLELERNTYAADPDINRLEFINIDLFEKIKEGADLAKETLDYDLHKQYKTNEKNSNYFVLLPTIWLILVFILAISFAGLAMTSYIANSFLSFILNVSIAIFFAAMIFPTISFFEFLFSQDSPYHP